MRSLAAPRGRVRLAMPDTCRRWSWVRAPRWWSGLDRRNRSGMVDVAGPVIPNRLAGGFEDAPLGLVLLSGDPPGVDPSWTRTQCLGGLTPAASCGLVRLCAPRDYDRNDRARPDRLGAVGKALPNRDLVGGLPNGPRGSVGATRRRACISGTSRCGLPS